MEKTIEIPEGYEARIEGNKVILEQKGSEEDEKMREHIISDLREFRDCETDEELIADYEDEIQWLKSLRPQPHWKPSEEQMEALECAIGIMRYMRDGDFLQELYADLKKL